MQGKPTISNIFLQWRISLHCTSLELPEWRYNGARFHVWLSPICQANSSLSLTRMRPFCYCQLIIGNILWGHRMNWGKGVPVHYLLMFWGILGPNFECTIFILQWIALGPTGTNDIINLITIILWRKAHVDKELIIPVSHGHIDLIGASGMTGAALHTENILPVKGWMALLQIPRDLLWKSLLQFAGDSYSTLLTRDTRMSAQALGYVATVTDQLVLQLQPNLHVYIVIAEITIQAGNSVHYFKLIGEKY